MSQEREEVPLLHRINLGVQPVRKAHLVFGLKRLPSPTDVSSIGRWTAGSSPAQFQLDADVGAPGPPPSYLVWAVLAARLGFTPLGLVALVYATQVNSRWAAGDIAGAHEASRKAKTFTIWSAVTVAALIAVAVGAIVLVVFAMAVMARFASGRMAG
ncbi:MAG: CD225/dispanin family protein [Propionicimonas sp.]